MESATENKPLFIYLELVRVKMCGKSARAYIVIYMWGKPYLEQDKIGMCDRLFRLKHAGMSLRYMVAFYYILYNKNRIRLIE